MNGDQMKLSCKTENWSQKVHRKQQKATERATHTMAGDKQLLLRGWLTEVLDEDAGQ